MSNLKKYDLKGKALGEVTLDDQFVNVAVNGQMIKDYIVALRANKRQWSASTRGRSEVAHSKKKPHPQKGTGRARQGSLASPQYKGGGIVFGPQPKFNQHVRTNAKERRAAIHHLIAEKIKNDKVHLLSSTEMKAPKTKTVATFLKKLKLGGRVLFLGESTLLNVGEGNEGARVTAPSSKHSTFQKSLNNIPKVVFSLASNVNGYDVMLAHDLVMTEEALEELKEWLT